MLVFKKNDLEASFAPYACFQKKAEEGRTKKKKLLDVLSISATEIGSFILAPFVN